MQQQNANQGDSLKSNKDLNKLERNIMTKGGLATRVIFTGRSLLGKLIFYLSLLLSNVIVVAAVALTCVLPRRLFNLFQGYSSYLLIYDGIVLLYFIYIVLRDLLFTKSIIANLDNLYNLVTNSLIDTQKEYLLNNPSNRIMYLMTKTMGKLDRDLIRSYYQYFDSLMLLLVIVGVLNYILYIFMAIVAIFLMIIILPSYNTFKDICIKLSIFNANYSSELIEIYLSSFNFILPLRNHNIPDYFDRKFT